MGNKRIALNKRIKRKKVKYKILNFIPCLKCRKRFQSMDRKTNRICVSCSSKNESLKVPKVEINIVRVPGPSKHLN